MGHAGAIIEGSMGTFESKVSSLDDAGAKVAEMPWQVVELINKELYSKGSIETLRTG